MIQFRLQTILFLTFVVAFCASIMRLSPIAGCIAIVPVLIATRRTLSNPSPVKSSLCLDFLFSVCVLLGLVLASFLSLTVSSIAVLLMASHGLLRGTQSVTAFLYKKLSQSKFILVPLACIRGLAACSATILVWTRCLAVASAIWLNRRILALRECWVKTPTGEPVRPS